MKLMLLVLFTFFTGPDHGSKLVENKSVNLQGTVIEELTGEPLPGALVYIKELDKELYTDFDGNFELKGLNPGEYSIKVSYISFTTKELNQYKIEPENNSILIRLD